jgi:hypothetical protein
VGLEPRAQSRARDRAHEPIDLVAVAQKQEQRDALCTEARSDLRRGVDIELDDLDVPGVIACECLDIMRQGPHQAAQRSTTTGSDDSTALSNVVASASTIHGSTVWQKPQCGTPDALIGTRLRLRQFVHAMVVAWVMGVIPGAGAWPAPPEIGVVASVSRG